MKRLCASHGARTPSFASDIPPLAATEWCPSCYRAATDSRASEPIVTERRFALFAGARPAIACNWAICEARARLVRISSYLDFLVGETGRTWLGRWRYDGAWADSWAAPSSQAAATPSDAPSYGCAGASVTAWLTSRGSRLAGAMSIANSMHRPRMACAQKYSKRSSGRATGRALVVGRTLGASHPPRLHSRLA
jgi:hypothetical protein